MAGPARSAVPGYERINRRWAALPGFTSLLIVLGLSASFGPIRAQTTASTGTICAMTFNDLAKNGIHSASDPVLSGVNITLAVDNGLMIANHLSDDQGQYCFTNLLPGRYRLTFSDPLAQATTPTILTLTVNAGDNLVTAFGAVPDIVPTAAAALVPNTQPGIIITLTRTGRLALSAAGALAVMVLMFGLGLFGYGLLGILRSNRRRGGKSQRGVPAA